MRIVQVIKAEEKFYNVYKACNIFDKNAYIARPAYYLGLTNTGAIVGIELGKKGFEMDCIKDEWYRFTVTYEDLIEFSKESNITLTVMEKNGMIKL